MTPARSSSHEEACQQVASLFRAPWLRHYVRSKLHSDPVFRAAADLLRDATTPLLDIGCGLGLLPLYLRARGFRGPVLGIDIDDRKLQHARRLGLDVVKADARAGLPQFAGHVAIFDVLHYLEPGNQAGLLAAAAKRVAVGAMLLLRDAPRDGSVRFWATYVAERFAQAITWSLGVPLYFPSRVGIFAALPEEAFTREERPMYGRTPFNNRLFIFRRVVARDVE